MGRASSQGGVKGGHTAVATSHNGYHQINLPEPSVDASLEYWPKGFTNVGNTCYANATLQCLLNTALADALLDPKTVPLFRKYSSNPNLLAMGSGSVDSEDDILLATPRTKETEREQRRKERKERERRRMHENCEWLTKELTDITTEYLSSPRPSHPHAWGWSLSSSLPKGNVVNPQSITRHPDRLSKCLTPYQQEDAHEFLRALLSTLIMNGHNKELSSLFDGLLESAVTCEACGRTSLTRDRYMDLSLDINDSEIDTLDDALFEYTKTEVLSGDNAVHCAKCEQKQTVTKGLRLATAPSILVCHLKRFAFNSYGKLVRLHKKIKFPATLEIGDFMSNLNKATPPPYDLVGMIVHQGQTCASGHYLAYVKRDGDWFRCNDSAVEKVEEDIVLNQQAYILMYEVAQMRERTCSVTSPVNSNSKSATTPYIDTNFGDCAHDDLSTRSLRSAPEMQGSQSADPAAKFMQFISDAGLATIFSDICCGGCNHGIAEPKEHRMKSHRRGRRKPRQLNQSSETKDDSTAATSDSHVVRRSNSSESLQVVEFSNPRREPVRSRTAPRQRVLRTHSFSQSEPGLDIDSPHTHKSTLSDNMHRRETISRAKTKSKRERSRSVHASGDARELPPLPLSGQHRRAKSNSTSRNNAYLV